MKNTQNATVTLTGIGIGKSIAIGTVYTIDFKSPHVPETFTDPSHTAKSANQLQSAIDHVRTALEALKINSIPSLPHGAQDDALELIETHIGMLKNSRLIRGAFAQIKDHHHAPASALAVEMASIAHDFSKIDDPYIQARIDDIRSIFERLVRHLLNLPILSLDTVPEGGIVCIHEVSPAQSVLFDPQKFGGLITARGGAAGHTAIMARGIGLPSILGVPHIFNHLKTGDTLILDTASGQVLINPDDQTLNTYQTRQRAEQQARTDLKPLLTAENKTQDGTPFELNTNLELPRDLENALAQNPDHIGLFRTEFMFMNRDDIPTEDQQFETLKNCLDMVKGRTITIRTLDIGGEKIAEALGDHTLSEDNPALGLRAVRLSLKHPELLITQFRAILRASLYGSVRVLIPLITTAHEFETVRDIYEETAQSLRQDGLALPKRLPPLGAMIEVPAAALSADSLALTCDFFALGTNDLTQYTVAIDRGNDHVAALYDSLNPAVLRLIEFTFQAASRAGIPISLCGEMAANTSYLPLLFGLGLRTFSVGAGAVLEAKNTLLNLHTQDTKDLADRIMSETDPNIIRQIIKDFKPRAKQAI